jgi:hypothetical protein
MIFLILRKKMKLSLILETQTHITSTRTHASNKLLFTNQMSTEVKKTHAEIKADIEAKVAAFRAEHKPTIDAINAKVAEVHAKRDALLKEYQAEKDHIAEQVRLNAEAAKAILQAQNNSN